MAVFEQDLAQLFGQLKELVFLDIYGNIPKEKIESYRLMIQLHFPNSQFYIQALRFRIWI